jgi:hypothetical protein
MKQSAFLGTYSDLKLVKTRSVAQVVIEVPIERAREVTDLLGFPLPGEEIHVGVARIDTTKLDKPSDPVQLPRLGNAQMAGILCNEGGFRTYLAERSGKPVPDADAAAAIVRFACSVKSRADLDTDKHGAQLWRDLKADYEMWLKDMAA